VNAQEPSDAELEQVAIELRGIVHSSQWERILAVGKLILSRFFHNDEQAWRERRRNKDRSIRKLAERPDCPFAKSALAEAVGIHVLCSKHPEARGGGRVTPTHVGKTLGLKPEIAIQLLRTAEQEGWSVRQVAAEATRLRKSLGERRGRPLARAHHRADAWGRRALHALESMGAELGGSSAPAMDHEAREHLVSLCASIDEELAAVRALLRPAAQERVDRRYRAVRAAPETFAVSDPERAAG
jgi:hypothetical protein